MAKKRKYHPGAIITSLHLLIEELFAGRYVYLRDTPKHPSVIRSMTLHTIEIFIRGGSFKYAIINEDYNNA